jgi:hypothetical protein
MMIERLTEVFYASAPNYAFLLQRIPFLWLDLHVEWLVSARKP